MDKEVVFMYCGKWVCYFKSGCMWLWHVGVFSEYGWGGYICALGFRWTNVLF